jgi:carboxylesterase
VGSSTGGTLLLELVSSGYFNSHHPQNFVLSNRVVPSVKLQSVVGLIGPMLVFTEVDQTSEENKYWYRFRPQEQLLN